ncbi:MAG: Csp1 family four helix bundle copper storage protein [Mariprofundaceae bacterium]|nr:Csp1 family four helix bundle copper storage protein [Mariprofundaceae bacterium]
MNNHKQEEIFSSGRRDVLIGAASLGVGALAATALGSNVALAAEHQHHHMAPASNSLAKSLHHCAAASESCINHCLDLFKLGNTTLADCAISVQEIMAFCSAHAKLAAYDSKFLREMTTLGIKVCQDCEDQCRKHEKKHALCKECADACAACIKECKAFLA